MSEELISKFKMTFILGDAGECVFAGNVFPFINVTSLPEFEQLDTNREDVVSDPIALPERMIFGDTIVDTAFVR